MRTVRLTVLALGALGVVISLPLLGFATLGYLGVLADVGDAENRGMGAQLLALGLPPLLVGAGLCALGWLVPSRDRRPAGAS